MWIPLRVQIEISKRNPLVIPKSSPFPSRVPFIHPEPSLLSCWSPSKLGEPSLFVPLKNEGMCRLFWAAGMGFPGSWPGRPMSSVGLSYDWRGWWWQLGCVRSRGAWGRGSFWLMGQGCTSLPSSTSRLQMCSLISAMVGVSEKRKLAHAANQGSCFSQRGDC